MDKNLKIAVLELLQELIRKSVATYTAPDDPSGTSTTYLVDQEQLLHNIEHELEQLTKESK